MSYILKENPHLRKEFFHNRLVHEIHMKSILLYLTVNYLKSVHMMYVAYL